MSRKLIILGIALFLVIAVSGISYACSTCGCQASHKDDGHSHPENVAAAEVAAPKSAVQQVTQVNNKICPVMGNKIEGQDAVKVFHDGKIYNLCCAGCISEFGKDPAKYVEKIDQELSGSTK